MEDGRWKIPSREGTDYERSAIDQGCVRRGYRIGDRNTPLDVKDSLRLLSLPFPLSRGDLY